MKNKKIESEFTLGCVVMDQDNFPGYISGKVIEVNEGGLVVRFEDRSGPRGIEYYHFNGVKLHSKSRSLYKINPLEKPSESILSLPPLSCVKILPGFKALDSEGNVCDVAGIILKDATFFLTQGLSFWKNNFEAEFTPGRIMQIARKDANGVVVKE